VTASPTATRTQTRIALHHAALLVSGVGRSFAERQPGSRHAALYWSDDAGGSLAGWPLVGSSGRPAGAALRFHDPAILVGRDAIPLEGGTFEEVLDAVRRALTHAGLDGAHLAIRLPGDLEPGPITAPRQRIALDTAASADLGAWYERANRHLAEAASAHDVGLPVPCWPDHFDLAVVVPLPSATVANAQVGLGFSPGDGSIDESYFYITPWPVPAAGVAAASAPAHGRWQVEGWTGLALPAGRVEASGDPDGTIAAFLERGFEICRDLVVAG
jgi:hypothetical protein